MKFKRKLFLTNFGWTSKWLRFKRLRMRNLTIYNFKELLIDLQGARFEGNPYVKLKKIIFIKLFMYNIPKFHNM